jgi:hypothetical protein
MTKNDETMEISREDYFKLEADACDAILETETIANTLKTVRGFLVEWSEGIDEGKGSLPPDIRFAQMCFFKDRVASMLPILEILESYTDKALHNTERISAAIEAFAVNRAAA